MLVCNENYGVFVELRPNLAGLAEYRDDVRVGQTAAVYIKSIIPEKMKIKLVLIDTSGEESSITPIRYHINTDDTSHINVWQYSPDNCVKSVKTVFD